MAQKTVPSQTGICNDSKQVTRSNTQVHWNLAQNSNFHSWPTVCCLLPCWQARAAEVCHQTGLSWQRSKSQQCCLPGGSPWSMINRLNTSEKISMHGPRLIFMWFTWLWFSKTVHKLSCDCKSNKYCKWISIVSFSLLMLMSPLLL